MWRLFTNLHASPIVVAQFRTYFIQSSERIWWVAHFPVENTQKYFKSFCKWKICENFATVTPFYRFFKVGYSIHSHFIVFCMHPHVTRDLEAIFHVMLKHDWDLAISCHFMPFLESNIVRSQAGQFLSGAKQCSYMLFLCGQFQKIAIIQAMLRSDLWTRLFHDLVALK